MCYSWFDKSYQLTIHQSEEASPGASIVQYHTAGEFHPVQSTAPVVSTTQEYQPEEADSETIHPTTEDSQQETTEIQPQQKEEEAYDVLVGEEPKVEREQKPQYAAWDASRLVTPRCLLIGVYNLLIPYQSPSTCRLATRSPQFPRYALSYVFRSYTLESP